MRPASPARSIPGAPPRARPAGARGVGAALEPAATSSRSSARRRSATRSARTAGDVAGGWHHGEDIFAPLGTPLLAVADGTVFSVGWNDIGGWRLWLRDLQRERVLLRAPLGVLAARRQRARRSRPGDVLGFMGKTGDAEFSTRAPALRDPPGRAALARVRRRRRPVPVPHRLAAGRGRLVRRRPRLPAARRPASRARRRPPAGAVLLEAADISEHERPRPGRARGDPGRPGSERARPAVETARRL